jgi:hypothetical protein
MGNVNKIVVQACLGTNSSSISKINKAKRAEGMAQGVESLPSMCEAVCSSPVTATKKKI